MSTFIAAIRARPTGAQISACGRYRYALWRRWGGEHSHVVCFVMLNPSTADALQDDPTIRRCIDFAKRWGFGALVVANLFALRSTDPEGLLSADNANGTGNNNWVARCSAVARMTVCAWGSPSSARLRVLVNERRDDVAGILRNRKLWCLGTCKDGNPRHPLYLAADTLPTTWNQP